MGADHDGMRGRHFRDEFREQMHLGARSLQHLVAEKHPFFEHHLLRAKHELQRALVQFGGFRFRICNGRKGAGSDPLRQLCHDNLRSLNFSRNDIHWRRAEH